MTPPRRVFLKVAFTPLTLDEAVEAIVRRPPDAPFAYVVTPNAQHTVAAYRRDPRFLAPQQAAWLTLNDSRILRLLSETVFGQTLPLASGADVVERLFASGLDPRAPLVIIGGDEAMAARLTAQFGLFCIAQHIPPMGLIHDPEAMLDCVTFVKAHPARYVFLAVGAPQSEMLASRIAALEGVTGVGLCVGSALNFLTGKVRRAPRLMRWAHLEWLYRLARDPIGHARRVFVESAPVLLIAVRERFRTHSPLPVEGRGRR